MSNMTYPNTSSTSTTSIFNGTLQSLNSTVVTALFTSTKAQKEILTYDLYSSTAKIVGYSLVYGLISIIALAGNLMVFTVMFMNRTMHTTTNVLLLNLSLSDIFFVIFAVPGFLTMEIVNDRWIFSESMGKMTQMTSSLCAASSIFTMMAIAFERYFAVLYPFKQMARKRKETIVIAMVIIWVCAISLSIPLGYYTTTVTYNIPVKRDGKIVREAITFLSATITKEQDRTYTLTAFIFINVIPILFLSFVYTRIVWRLWNPDKQLAPETTAGSKRHNKPKNFVEKTRRKTTTMLLTVVLAFFFCFFPYNLFSVLLSFRGTSEFDKDILRHANSILRVLLLVNSASNPIIYNFLSEKFRTGFKSIFACRWHALTRVSASTDADTVLT